MADSVSSPKPTAWDALLGDAFDENAPTFKLAVPNSFIEQIQKQKSETSLLSARDPNDSAPTLDSSNNSKLTHAEQQGSSKMLGKVILEDGFDDFADIEEMAAVAETSRKPLSLSVAQTIQNGASNSAKKSIDIEEDDDLGELEKLSSDAVVSTQKSLKAKLLGYDGRNNNTLDDETVDYTATIKRVKNRERRSSTIKKREIDPELADLEMLSRDISAKANVKILGGKKKTGDGPISKDQLDDLNSFLNDDEDDTENSTLNKNAKTVFGSFLAPNANDVLLSQAKDTPKKGGKSVSEKSHNQRDEVFLDLTKKLSLDFSFGKELPVRNWGTLVLNSSSILKKLSLAGNQLLEIPFEIGNLACLEIIDLSFNRFERLQESITSCVNLMSLDARMNNLVMLPLSLFNLKELRVLYLHRNQLFKIDQSISALSNLTEVDLSSNKFIEIPPQILECESLEVLDLSHNLITNVSGKSAKLKRLLLSHNQIKAFPPILKEMPNLEELNLNHNLIASIDLNYLPKHRLRELRLIANQLKEIPASLKNLECLELLSLTQNPIARLPPSLASLQNLETILIDTDSKSKLVSPPISIAQKGHAAIIQYLREILNGAAEASLSVAFGSGLSKKMVVSEIEHFIIKAVDKTGAPKKIGGDTFEVFIRRTLASGIVETMQISPIDKNDGCYAVSYDATKAGRYEVRVLCNGIDILKSPMSLEMEPSTISPAKTICEMISNGDIMAGDEFVLKLQLCDQYQNWVETSGVHKIFVAVAEERSPGLSRTFKSKTEDSKAGQYHVKCSQTKSGQSFLSIFIDGREIESSPICVDVKPGKCDPESCTSTCQVKTLDANSRTSFIITSRDRYGNIRYNSRDSFQALITCANQDVVDSSITYNAETGETFVSFLAPSSGNIKMEVQLIEGGVALGHIQGSPFQFTAVENRTAQASRILQENTNLQNALADANRKYLELVEKFNETKSNPYHEFVLPNSSLEIASKEHGERIVKLCVKLLNAQKSYLLPVVGEAIFCAIEQMSRTLGHLDQESILLPLNDVLKILSDDFDLENLHFWLANVIQIHQLCKRQLKNIESVLRNNLLNEISRICEHLYEALIKSTQNQLSPIVVGAFLETIQDSAQKQGYFRFRKLSTKGKTCLDDITMILSQSLQAARRSCVPDLAINQIFTQIFHFIDAILFNSILLRKNICDQESAKKIYSNISLIEDWVTENNVSITSTLAYSKSAAELLKLPLQHLSKDDIAVIVKECKRLNFAQMEKLLTNATDKSPMEMLSILQLKSTSKTKDAKDVLNYAAHEEIVFLDTFFIEPLVLDELPAPIRIPLPKSLIDHLKFSSTSEAAH